jgi:branched-chain amino acid transport system substrate-binding protein
VQKWDGGKWTSVTKDWISGDRELIRKMEEDAATAYAAEKKITRACL